MGRNSGGTNYYAKASTQTIAINSNGKKLSAKATKAIAGSATSVGGMQHREMEKQINRAISRYEAVMGVRERTVRLADNINGAWGVTYISSNGSQGIYLNRQLFDRSKKDFEADYKRQYAQGTKNVTNRAAQHTVTHELAHATWTSSYASAKHQAAGKEINDLFNKWSKDKTKKGYGSYGKTNVDEFWAEAVTKAIHGNADKYTKAVISIAKKYKL